MVATTETKAPQNVGVPPAVFDEMRKYREPRGMKQRFLQTLVWEVFKTATDEQVRKASERAVQRLRSP